MALFLKYFLAKKPAMNFVKNLLHYENSSVADKATNSTTKCDELTTSIKVSPIPDPQWCWEVMKLDVNKQKIATLPLDTPVYDNKVKKKVFCLFTPV